MYRRKLSRALSHREVRDLADAVHFAEKRGKPLTATLNVNPALLYSYPADLGPWLTAFLNKLRIWCERAGFGYFAIWVRENYAGPRREHLAGCRAGKRQCCSGVLSFGPIARGGASTRPSPTC